MSSKRSFRKGMGLAQIMATLLVVLPTLAFSIAILLDYWAVMQADYKLKLVANITTEFTLTRENLRDFLDTDTDYQEYLTRVNSLCPNGTGVEFTSVTDAPHSDEIAITVQYLYNGTYFKNKTLSTQMNTYSYKDQNGSFVVTCK